MVSVLLDSIYLAALGWIPDLFTDASDIPFTRPWELGLVVLIFGIVVPSLLAYVLYGRPRWRDEVAKKFTPTKSASSESEDPRAEEEPNGLTAWGRLVCYMGDC
jgi:hypothetical protein